jgi:hypothetical protein
LILTTEARDEGLGAWGWGRTVSSKQRAVGNKTREIVAENGEVLLQCPDKKPEHFGQS